MSSSTSTREHREFAAMERMNATLAIIDGPKHNIPLALTLKETQSSRQSQIGNVCYWKQGADLYRALDTRIVDSPMEIGTYWATKLAHDIRRYLTSAFWLDDTVII
jgi:hypothetical protein